MDDDLPTKPQNEMQTRNDNDTVWLVSFADNDDRELTSEQIGKALAAGEIVLTTIVWRDGMADWKPIIEVVELRAAVQKQRIIRKRSTVMGGFAPPPPAPAAPPAPTPQPPAAVARPSVQRPPPAASPPRAVVTTPKPPVVQPAAAPAAAIPPAATPPAATPPAAVAPAAGAAGAARPQAATTIPARGAATLMGAPQLTPTVPLATQAAKVAPRASVAAGAGVPRPVAPRPNEPKEPEEEDLGSSVLESVPPPPEPAAPYRERVNTLTGPGGDRPRTTLTGPAPAPPRAAALEPDPDLEPISLMPDSLAPDTPAPESLETIGSDELQSMIEQVPPAPQGRAIFEIELDSDREISQEIDVDMDAVATKAPPQVQASAAPNVRVFAPEAAPARAGQAVSAQPPAARVVSRVPSPPRPVHAPLPQAVDPLADLDDAADAGKKKGGFGKFLIAALVIGFCAAAFYLGRRTADSNAAGGVPSSSAVAQQAPSAAPPPVASAADSALAQPVPAEPSAADSAAVEPVGADVAAPAEEPVQREPQQGSQNPRSPRGTAPTELTEEPSTVTEPVKPAPSPKEPPAEEEESSSGAGPFDQNAAASALAQAASAAGSCRSASDPSGVAQVSVTFSPSGRATRAIVNGPPFAGTATGGCIASKMTTARIPAFTGSRVTVKKKVVIQ